MSKVSFEYIHEQFILITFTSFVTVTVAAEEKSEQSAPSTNRDEEDFYVTKMQINKRQNTSWLIIPHKLATRYKLDKRTNVLLLPCKDGIMLKRLNASDIL